MHDGVIAKARWDVEQQQIGFKTASLQTEIAL